MKTRRFFKFIIAGFIFFSLFCGSVSALDRLNADMVDFTSLSMNYPVILVHGIAMTDQKLVFSSWGKIPDILKEYGVDVYMGNTDAWGSIASNAEIIKNTIDTVLNDTGKKKVNIIAHSKGGLDSRMMIWKYNYGDKVASLTTVSTPHHGSMVADLVQSAKPLHTKAVKRSLEVLGKIYNDMYPDAYSASYELTTGSMKEFNKTVIWDDRVFFQSIYSTMTNVSDDPFFASGFLYLKRVEGDNDGLVSEYSTRWGKNIIKVDAALSHGQIIDFTGKNPIEIEIPLPIVDPPKKSRPSPGIHNLYLKILKDLSHRGF